LPPDVAHEWDSHQWDGAPPEGIREHSNLFHSKGNGGSCSGALPLDNEGPPTDVKHRIGPGMISWMLDFGF
jgi:hypothetical protein